MIAEYLEGKYYEHYKNRFISTEYKVSSQDHLTKACNKVFGEAQLVKQHVPIYQAFANAITTFEGWARNDPPTASEETLKGYAERSYERLLREVAEDGSPNVIMAFANFRDYYSSLITALSPSSGIDRRPPRRARVSEPALVGK